MPSDRVQPLFYTAQQLQELADSHRIDPAHRWFNGKTPGRRRKVNDMNIKYKLGRAAGIAVFAAASGALGLTGVASASTAQPAAVTSVSHHAGSATAAAHKGAAYPVVAAYGYHFVYNLGSTHLSAEQVFRYVNSHFNRVFPVGGNCGAQLSVGQKCDLIGHGKGNITVKEVGVRHYVYVSRPGHFEGANKTINFTFYNSGDSLYLSVTATGKNNLWQDMPGALRANRVFANLMWEDFARNVANAMDYGLIH